MRMRHVSFAVALWLGVSPLWAASTAKPASNNKDTAQLPLDELSAFTDAFSRIKNAYVEDVSDKELLEHAIHGMLTGLDPHSGYLDSEAFNELQLTTSGEYGGLGLELLPEDSGIRVIAPIDDTPAQRAGIMPGDLITKINGKLIKSFSLHDALDMMRGKAGERIELLIQREGVAEPLPFKLVREVIRVRSVKTKLLEPNIGYLRITQFQQRTSSDVYKAVAALEKQNKGPLKGLILDLRNNPGGVLNSAIEVADAFLSKGLIVSTKGRVEDSDFAQNAKPDDILHGAPIVTLINGGSASGSEIVAGALQDHKRSLILGARSFGKGSVQTIFPIHGQGAIKLTTALYYTPSGRSIQGSGIQPDIEVKSSKVVLERESAFQREAELPGALNNSSTGKSTKKLPVQDELLNKDFQIYEALNVLKGMNIIGGIKK